MLRALKRKFGISAPRVAVRPHIPWYWRWLGLSAMFAGALALAWWGYEAGRKFAGFDENEVAQELGKLRDMASRVQGENASLRARATAAERQLQIEHASHDELAEQVKALGDENARLKEDLAFFQNLTTPGGKAGELSIYRFKVERDKLPGEYRYALLLVQGGQRAQDFHGTLQFLANVRQNGKKTVMTLPQDGPKSAQALSLNFKYYQRIEGSFRLAPDAVLESLQIRVFENGAKDAKITQAVNPS